jgi:Xaa-Pro aminopeptidase
MPSLPQLQQRRQQFLAGSEGPTLLMAGGLTPRNYPANVYPYRPDSTFLYFFAGAEPDSAALFDPADRSVTLFLRARTAEDALWHGPAPSFAEMKRVHGVDAVEDVAGLEAAVRQRANGRRVRSLAVADGKATARARAITGEQLDFDDPLRVGDPALVGLIGSLRLQKSADEAAEMRKTAEVTREAHTAAMAHTRPGATEQQLAGIVDGCFYRHGCVPAYNTILTVRGEVLHNTTYGNTATAGDILLLDAGAEAPSGYCSDVTRSWPVSGRFDSTAAAVYDLVLRAQLACIETVRPGVRYRDVHLCASRVIAEGLVDLGLLQGRADDLVGAGAHAVFFPHGIGHLIGLDVHDMEAFGDAVAYGRGRARSDQFGTKWLRLDLDLAPGMAFTIEPGIYFVPAIIHHAELRARFKDQVRWTRAEEYLRANDGRGFGGIRIEDDVLCTEDGSEVLTRGIPKERTAVEALVGSASD